MVEITTYPALAVPLEESGATRGERNLFARRDIQTAAELLGSPPRYVIPVECGRTPPAIGTQIAAVVRVTQVDQNPGRNFLILRGLAWGQPVEVYVFQRYWGNILSSVLNRRRYVDMLCEGRLADGNHRARYLILAKSIDYNRQRRSVLPRYGSKPEDNEKFSNAVGRILASQGRFGDVLEKYLKFPLSADAMLRQLHQPTDVKTHDLAAARLLILAAVLFMLRRDRTVADLLSCPENTDIGLLVPETAGPRGAFPFTLSDSQNQANSAVLADLRSPRPTVRYVMGDVGAGKSAVAFEALAAVAASRRRDGSGCRAILLAPTVLLASQHYENFTRLYPGLADRTLLLAGRKVTGVQLEQFDILIGTHAILNQKHLPADLLIVDEPQRFGMGQQRWSSPTHYVFMSATPLPRWTSLLVDDLIPLNIITSRPRNLTGVPLDYSEAMLRKVLETLPEGERRIIVTPWVSAERVEYPNLERVVSLLKEMGKEHLVVHGKMPVSEQLDVARRYRERECTLLVTTSLIETGLDIPDVKYMVVIAPESFGYLGLYQLMGRAGRDGQQSYAYLLTTDKQDMTAFSQRVRTGYDAARYDLSRRGASQMDDTGQSGVLRIPYGERLDSELIGQAKAAYRALLSSPEDVEQARAELEALLGRYFR